MDVDVDVDVAGTPKYENLKNFLRSGINTGRYQPDDRLPSENELTDLFSVSHITVRKAMSDLVSEGKVYRIRGKGSFVSPPRKDGEREISVLHLLSARDSENRAAESALVSILRGVEEYMAPKGVHTRIKIMEPGAENENRYLEELVEEKPNGALLFLTEPDHHRDRLRDLDAAGIPYVLLDRCSRAYPCNYAASDNLSGGYAQVAHLAGLNHRKIVFVSNHITINTEKERYMGYTEAMSDLCPDEPARMLHYGEDFEREISRLLREGAATALAVVNDQTAISILRSLEQINVSVPGDLSVIGFDDVTMAPYFNPALTTVQTPIAELGRVSTTEIIRLMKSKVATYGTVTKLDARLVVRASSGVKIR